MGVCPCPPLCVQGQLGPAAPSCPRHQAVCLERARRLLLFIPSRFPAIATATRRTCDVVKTEVTAAGVEAKAASSLQHLAPGGAAPGGTRGEGGPGGRRLLQGPGSPGSQREPSPRCRALSPCLLVSPGPWDA